MQTTTQQVNHVDEENFLDLFDGGAQVVEASEVIPTCKKYPNGAEVVIYDGHAYLRVDGNETPIGPAEKDELDRIVSQVLH